MDTSSQLIFVAVTDIQGSSRLWERLGSRFAPVLGDHNRILRATAGARNGREMETEGDSFTFLFESAHDAVAFGLDAQSALHAHAWPPEVGELRVRIGIHGGRVTDSGRLLLRGPVLSRARLIAAAAHGGQTVISEATLSCGALAGDAVRQDLGEHRLGALDAPERLYQVLPSRLAARTFGPLRTLSARKTNIVEDRSSFVGRAGELAELAEVLPSPAGRLVTLTGFGGIGKTRLARQAALQALPAFEGGCWFADMLEARSAAAASEAVATAMGIPIQAGDNPAQAVADALEFRKPFLLVLDGFESVAEHAAATLGLWLRRARQARFLVTSQALVGLSGEREIALGPLSCPSSSVQAGDLVRSEAARLLLDRAAAASPGYAPAEVETPVLARLCSELEGIPLAIELAAARLAVTGAGPLLQDIARGTIESVEGRGRSLADTLRWSWIHLNDWQRSALEQACVFRGGFFLEAAEEVIDLSSFPDAPLAIDAIQALRDRSLLRTTDTPLGTRFSLFRSIREYGEARWRESTTEDRRAELEWRHARSYAKSLEEAAARVDGPSPREDLVRMEMERDNAMAAVQRMVARGGAEGLAVAARVATAVEPVLRLRGHMAERLGLLRTVWGAGGPPATREAIGFHFVDGLIALGDPQALQEARSVADTLTGLAEASGDAAARARAGVTLARVLANAGAIPEAWALCEKSCALLPDSAPAGLRQEILTGATQVDSLAARYEAGIRRLDTALAEAKAAGMRIRSAVVLHNMAAVRQQHAVAEDILAVTDAALAEFRELGLPLLAAKCQGNRGHLLLRMRRREEAVAEIRAAVQVHREAGLKRGALLHMINLGMGLRDCGRFEEALAVYGEAEAIAGQIEDPLSSARILGNIAAVMFSQGRFEDALTQSQSAVTLLRGMHPTESLALNLGNQGICLVRLGRLAEADRKIRESIAVWDSLGLGHARAILNTLSDLAEALAASGSREEARLLARDGLRRSESAPRPQFGADEQDIVRRLRELAG